MIARTHVCNTQAGGGEHTDRALRVIKAVKERYCYHACKVVHVDWGQRRMVTSEDAGVADVHDTLCQEMQEVEKLLES